VHYSVEHLTSSSSPTPEVFGKAKKGMREKKTGKGRNNQEK
jgi:hypothetical protein